MKNEMLQEVLNALEKVYGDLTDERGYSVYNDNNGKYAWLSMANIVRIIEQIDEEYEEV